MNNDSDLLDLERYDKIYNALYVENSLLNEDALILYLSDSYVSIRAEVLDYILHLDILTNKLIIEIRRRYELEESEQCIGRLILLAAKLGDDPSFNSLPPGISIFEIEYLAIWSSIAMVIKMKQASALFIALGYTFHSDLSLAELAKNLLREYCSDYQQLAKMSDHLHNLVSRS